MLRVFAAIAAALCLLFASVDASSAKGRHHHHRGQPTRIHYDSCNYDNSGHATCGGEIQTASATRSRRTHGSQGGDGRCPSHLGCGCHLASYMGLTGHTWREAWVARFWARLGSPAQRGCVGCVVVLSRGGGGHVGVAKSWNGPNPVVYSYANGRLGWTTSEYSARRVVAVRSL